MLALRSSEKAEKHSKAQIEDGWNSLKPAGVRVRLFGSCCKQAAFVEKHQFIVDRLPEKESLKSKTECWWRELALLERSVHFTSLIDQKYVLDGFELYFLFPCSDPLKSGPASVFHNPLKLCAVIFTLLGHFESLSMLLRVKALACPVPPLGRWAKQAGAQIGHQQVLHFVCFFIFIQWGIVRECNNILKEEWRQVLYDFFRIHGIILVFSLLPYLDGFVILGIISFCIIYL